MNPRLMYEAVLVAEAMQEARIPVVGYVRRAEKGGLIRVKPHRRSVDVGLALAGGKKKLTAKQKQAAEDRARWRRERQYIARDELQAKATETVPSVAAKVDPGWRRRVGIELAPPGPLGDKQFFDEAGTAFTEALERFPALKAGPGKPLGGIVTHSSGAAPQFTQLLGAAPAGMLDTPQSPFIFLLLNDTASRANLSTLGTLIAPSSKSGTAGVVWHEVGHLLHIRGGVPVSQEGQKIAREKLQEWGINFDDLNNLSDSAAADPLEAIAELASMMYTPGYRQLLDPELAAKAEKMFNAWGGLAGLGE